jgi:hypothetical protein
MASNVAIAHATQTLTGSAQPTNTQTVIIGSKTYTFQTTLTNVDGNVKIGADLAESLANLHAAIQLGAGAGTAYAAAMTRHPQVSAYSVGATTLVVRAPGAAANAVGVAGSWPDGANAAWGASTLAGGAGNIDVWALDILDANQVNAEVMFEIKKALTIADD